MKTFTIQVDNDVVDKLSKAAELRDVNVEYLLRAAALWFADEITREDEFLDSVEWTPEMIASVEEGIAQADRGELITHEQVLADVRALLEHR